MDNSGVHNALRKDRCHGDERRNARLLQHVRNGDAALSEGNLASMTHSRSPSPCDAALMFLFYFNLHWYLVVKHRFEQRNCFKSTSSSPDKI